ncbi:MAG: FecR domain-containing protein [Deltaproteobacteria bacterium]|nr:FecR domain-containing protein [Deltaproteobacteria bacterium]
MNRSKMLYRNQNTLISRIILTSFLLFFFFFITNHLYGQDKTNEKQWRSVGGKIVASGTHTFTNSWYLGGNGKWWKNAEDRKKAATHTSDEVTKDVVKKMGQITVRGPGFLAKFQRKVNSMAVGSGLTFSKTGKDFHTATLGGQDLLGGKWSKLKVYDFDPTNPAAGWVPVGKTSTFDVYGVNEKSGIGYTEYGAPVGVEYEFWFFPREGGEVIKGGRAAGYIMSIMGSKAGKIIRLKTASNQSGEELKKGDIIYFGDVLKTHDVMVKIILNHYPDNPLVVLKANTKVRIEKKGKYNKGGIFSFFGKLLFKGSGKDHQGFKIVTSNAIAGFEGTEFETAYDPNTSKTTVSVFEGTVRMDCTAGVINPIIVNAGMQATMDDNCNYTLSKLGPDNNTSAKAGWEFDDEPDFSNTIGKPCAPDKEFVRSLYNSVVEWDLEVSFATGSGGAHMRSLQNGDSRLVTILAFFNSPGYLDKQKSGREFIRDAYQAVLGREPSATEGNQWPQIDRNAIIRQLFYSDEYINLMANCPEIGQQTAGVSGGDVTCPPSMYHL